MFRITRSSLDLTFALKAVHPRLPYIDCLRGYAILLVITCHTAVSVPQLPYPVYRVAVNGWFGVQLFFVASCFTLLQSWHTEMARTGTVDVAAFFLRRLFRIAPAYYLAAIYYAFAHSPGTHPLASLLFLNGLNPIWTVTGPVPGGWSIGAEFAFYAAFPAFALLATSLWRAVLTFAAAVIVGWIANLCAMAMLAGEISNGLFFWFPNQLSVFAIGGIAYYLAQRGPITRYPTALALLGATIFWVLVYLPLGHFIGDAYPVPGSLAFGAVFGVVTVALSSGPSPLTNRVMASIGTVSFSAYLIRFAVLDAVDAVVPGIADVTGYRAIATFAGCWCVTVAATLGMSWLTYRFVEAPMVKVGRALIERSRPFVRPDQAVNKI